MFVYVFAVYVCRCPWGQLELQTAVAGMGAGIQCPLEEKMILLRHLSSP